MPPNILLVVLDTARADALEPYGAPAGSSPAVADLARRGVTHAGAIATANWTLPSHASMFTGLLPRALGLGGVPRTRTLFERHRQRLLPHVLARSGYWTFGASANVWVTPRNGFNIGFDRFRVARGTRRHAPQPGPAGRLKWLVAAARARRDDGLRAIDAAVRRRLDEGFSEPWFIFVNLMECHSPYLPPQPWNDYGLLNRLRAAEDARRYQSHAGFLRVCVGDLDVPEESLERMRHLYRRSVLAMDDWLGRILGELDGRKMLDNTLVVVTSDHGENFGEGHLLGHALSLDDRLIRVPLITAGPGAPAENGAVTSMASLPRMLAAAAGLRDHPWLEEPSPEGVAVAQSDGFGMMAPDLARQMGESWGLPPAIRERMFVRRSCATDGRFKLVREGPTERLHDLVADPLEAADASDAHPEALTRLRRTLDEVDADEVLPADSEDAAESPEESAELEERMRLLGYL